MSTTLQTDLVATKLQTACESVLPGAVFPQVYTGGLLKYIVWNYNAIPALWAEGDAQAARYLVQVHLYLPHKEAPHGAILALSEALTAEGFTRPQLTDAGDAEGQHWVLECETADGGTKYGYA